MNLGYKALHQILQYWESALLESRDQQGNAYSIGLFLFFGQYSIMLAGDVENQTIRRIADGDIEYPVDYIKIPHHGSKSASFLT